jgi:hypothetical protein
VLSSCERPHGPFGPVKKIAAACAYISSPAAGMKWAHPHPCKELSMERDKPAARETLKGPAARQHEREIEREEQREREGKALGPHPVGTAAGGVAGAVAAGAAAGSVAGPVGAAVGGAVGAVAGATAGTLAAGAVDPDEKEEAQDPAKLPPDADGDNP